MQRILLLLFIWGGGLQAQTRWLSGGVEDSALHRPLAGVSVQVLEDTAHTITNAFGLFKLRVPEDTATLLFTREGYWPRQVSVHIDNHLLITLSPIRKTTDAIAVAKARSRMQHTSNPHYGNMAMGTTSFYNETYGSIYENRFVRAAAQPLSTFAVDVDRAAYSNIRRFLRLKEAIPTDAVRIEEMVNYFHYNYPLPPAGSTMALYSRYTDCPWEPAHRLLEIAIRARAIAIDSLPPSNLVFLIDVSGSMGVSNKLPLLQAAFRVLVNNLRPLDKVAIVAYAGVPGVVLPATSGDQQAKILQAIDNLSAGGTTGGESAIKLAYQIAAAQFIPDGNNRVILATDGDFNVGLTSDEEMETLITEKKETGVLLTCLGFGMKNYKDSKLQALANMGNGNFAYIDNLEEAHKIFAREFGSTLFTVARDVRTGIVFNPAVVKSYRLIGYENKVLPATAADPGVQEGGIIGSGHCSVALYEIMPVPDSLATDTVLARVNISYREPQDTLLRELPGSVPAQLTTFREAPDDYRFAAAVALFGMVLRGSAYRGCGNTDMVGQMARGALGRDKEGYRQEFLKMVKMVRKMKR
ncbi:YfbK domain-containing protein [Chitinophaga nivalis]|uniref:von Willebrand factor type A domain-containing protein n=1 Tax=Chitinophaga nivalis TaxID=2991709 RepID=A0ABT3ISS5_9BACT|nr:von Willebrand factor type A domain-containing protein [Chitinophaga nivalis]MCW3463359.1 von Willebrand factor type A domain-containing protein [Chitinophaga nivalis]MCW3486951.1 von Willebrand factor type A domain-containing protein [Chitinophaga nivalis]